MITVHIPSYPKFHDSYRLALLNSPHYNSHNRITSVLAMQVLKEQFDLDVTILPSDSTTKIKMTEEDFIMFTLMWS